MVDSPDWFKFTHCKNTLYLNINLQDDEKIEIIRSWLQYLSMIDGKFVAAPMSIYN